MSGADDGMVGVWISQKKRQPLQASVHTCFTSWFLLRQILLSSLNWSSQVEAASLLPALSGIPSLRSLSTLFTGLLLTLSQFTTLVRCMVL